MAILVLIGAPGAGKSTVGQELAELVGGEFSDTDALIEQTARDSISGIFLNQGEEAFRALERDCVNSTITDAMNSDRTQIISVGGGAVLNLDTQETLRKVPVAWLMVDISSALKRVGMNQARPLLLGNVRANMIKLLAERTPIYESLADVSVDTSQLSPSECANELRQYLESSQS